MAQSSKLLVLEVQQLDTSNSDLSGVSGHRTSMAAFATGHQLLERQAGPSTGDLATKWVKGSHGVLL